MTMCARRALKCGWMCLFWLKLCLFLGFGMQTGGYHTTDIHYMTKECTFKWQKVPANTVKSAEICIILGYFFLNLINSELLFCMQEEVVHRTRNHPKWITSASNCRKVQKVPPKTKKCSNLPIWGHSDLVFHMKIWVYHTNHIYYMQKECCP
jgi:hypothetical protein